MSAHVLLNLLNVKEEIKCEACLAFITFSQRVNSLIQDHRFFILLSYDIKIVLNSHFYV